MKIISVAVFTTLVLAYSPVFAQDKSNRHSEHGFFEPVTSINLLGTAYNPVSEDWKLYIGIKTAFFHPTKHVWIGGIGFGVAFNQTENRKNWTGLTFVPLELGGLSLETSIKKVWARSPTGERRRERLVMLAWNWDF